MRTTDKDLRSKLRYDLENSAHWNCGFDINWDSNIWSLRVSRELTVGAGGAIHLTTNYPRDPDARSRLYRDTGIDLRRVEDLPAMKTTDGRKIPKNTLQDEIYLVQDGRVYNVSQADMNGAIHAYATWYTMESAPTVSEPVHLRERNKEREKAWNAERAETFLKADGAYALAEPDERGAAIRRWRVREVGDVLKHNTLPMSKVDSYFVAIGHYRKQGGKEWNEVFLDQTGDFRDYPYLTIA